MKKISKYKIKNKLKNKKCDTPITKYIALHILEDPYHELASIDPELFSLRDMFDYIEPTHDDDRDTV